MDDMNMGDFGDDFGGGLSATTVAPDVKVEDAGPCRKKLTIDIGKEQIADQLTEALQGVVASASLPGFRAGKAPKHLIEKRFGKAVREEAKGRIVSQAYSHAIESNSLRVIGEPEGGDELEGVEIDGKSNLVFTIEVDVAPEVTLPDFAGLEIKRPLVEVTDEMTQGEIDRLCVNEGELNPKEQAGPGDYCAGHGVMTKDSDGEVVHDIEGAVIQIPEDDKNGEGMILGVKVADFTKQVGSPKAHEKLTIKVKGPENHEVEALRNEPLTVTFDIEEISSIVPAEVATVCANHGFEGEEQLRERIMLSLNQRVMLEQQAAMRAQVAEQLLDTIDFDMPERMTAGQAAQNLNRLRLEMMHRGVDDNEIEEKIAESRDASAEAAVRELKLYFILDMVGRELDVNITEGEVNGRIVQMAQQRGERPDNLRAALIKSGQINGIAQQIREHKSLDEIVAKATVEDMPVEDFNKMMDEKKAKKK